MITVWVMGHWKPLALVLGAALIFGGSVHLYHNYVEAGLIRQQAGLKQENQQKTDEYNKKLGEAHANELAAREDKQKSDALVTEYQRRVGNIKAIDDKLATAETNYDKAKAEMGDCGETQAECLKLLCIEQQKAGFKVKCD